MEYFTSFPTIDYNGYTVKDITIRLDFLQKIKDNISIYQHIIVNDGQRPEDIALQYYNDPTLYWIVLYLNNIVDPFNGWLLRSEDLYAYCLAKYGTEENMYHTHHYETISGSDYGVGVTVNFGTPYSAPVTNYDYEYRINEERRKIKVLKSTYVAQVLAEYQKELAQK